MITVIHINQSAERAKNAEAPAGGFPPASSRATPRRARLTSEARAGVWPAG